MIFDRQEENQILALYKLYEFTVKRCIQVILQITGVKPTKKVFSEVTTVKNLVCLQPMHAAAAASRPAEKLLAPPGPLLNFI